MTATATLPTAMDDFLFDLRGYLVIKNVLSPSEVSTLNTIIDRIPALQPGGWHGYIHREAKPELRGTALQQIYEAGKPFEHLIDHPRYIDLVKRYVGGAGTFDHHHGPLFIDENFVDIYRAGQSLHMHSGSWANIKRCQYLCRNQSFMCGQINVQIALTDVGPGDGPTMVIPGSHKANFKHPRLEKGTVGENASMDGIEGATEIFLKVGDALLFVDALCHGSAIRQNPGERRVSIYRYGPSWGNFRFGYTPSPELLARLTPAQRQIVYPWKPLAPRAATHSHALPTA